MVIKNARVFIDGQFHAVDVRYDEEKILEIGKDLTDEEVIDATGKELYPGLIEARLHGGWGKSMVDTEDTSESTEDKIRFFCNKLPEYGVTTLIPTIGGGTAEQRRPITRDIRRLRGNVPGADLYKFYFENMFMNTSQTTSSIAIFMDEAALPSKDLVLEEADYDLSDVLMVSVAPELEGGIELIDWLNKNNIIPSLVASHADAHTVHEAVQHGLRCCTHMFNGFKPMHHRDSSTVAAIMNEPQIACQLFTDGIHVNPVWVRLLINVKGLDKIYGVTDYSKYSGLPEGTHKINDDLTLVVKNGMCYMENGVIFGGNYMMVEEMKLGIENCELTKEEVGSLFSESVAKCLNITDRGKIEVGRRSDFMIIDSDYNVEKTIIGGKVYYSR